MSEWLAGTPFAIIPGATAAGLIAGALLPLLGMWVVLQRVVFLGVTLAQVAAAGVALGLFLHWPPLLCGFAACLLLVVLFTRAGGGMGGRGGVGTTGDARLGAAFCAASALALLFVSRSPVELDQVHHVLHGNLIYADPSDVRTVAFSMLGGLLVIAACFRPILFTCFDPEAAAALGIATRRWILLLFGVLAVALSFSTRTTGSLLTFALLVLPPMAALELRRGLLTSFVLASLFGLLGTVVGLSTAIVLDLHLESSITVAVFALFIVARAWRTNPLLALTIAGTLATLVARVAIAPDLHTEQAERLAAGRHAPDAKFGIEVVLSDARLEGTTLIADWALDVHPGAHAEAAPRELWLVLTAGATTHELSLLGQGALDVDHPTARSGTVRFEVAGTPARIGGLVWTGPTHDLDSLPVDQAQVTGCSVTQP